MATGEVILSMANLISSPPFSGSFPVANAVDGDFITFFAGSKANPDYVGIDLGAGNTSVPTEFWFAVRHMFIDRGAGYVAQGSNTSATTGLTDLATVVGDTPTLLSSRWFHKYAISTGTAYRWLRIKGGTGTAAGDCAEFRIIGTPPSSLTGCQCMPPTATPSGKRYGSGGSASVTLACRTTDAAIYYTTDGSTPDNTKTLYTGPFSVSGTTTVKAIGISTGVSNSPVATYYFSEGYLQGTYPLTDSTYNEHIQAHDGQITYFAPYYYWYGTERRMNDATSGNGIMGIRCYRSSDLRNWEDRGIVLTVAAVAAVNASVVLLERAHVHYNAANNNYTMVVHADSATYSIARVATASCATPDGTFTVSSVFQPDARDSRDIGTIQDGTDLYLIFSTNSNVDLRIMQFASDYLSMTGASSVIQTGASREAPSGIKIGSTFFVLTSGVASWSSSAGKYYTAATWNGTWTDQGSPFSANASPPNTTCFNSQPTCLFVSQAGQLIYMGNRWSSTWLGFSSYVMLAATASGTTLTIPYAAEFIPTEPAVTGKPAHYYAMMRG